MPIVASSVIEDRAQADGRRSIREQHTDQLGLNYYMQYLADASFVATSLLATHAAQISADLTANEIANNLANALNQIMPTNNYSTPAQNIANLRAVYASLSQWDSCRLGNFIFNLNLSDVSLENVFGVAAGAPLAALKAKLAAQAADYVAAMAQTGQ
jgi:hypothetical protein